MPGVTLPEVPVLGVEKLFLRISAQKPEKLFSSSENLLSGG
jgi:hypothetical protein